MMTAVAQQLKEVPLGDVIADTKPGFAIGQRDPAGVLQVRMNNVSTQGALDLDDLIRVPADAKQIESCSLEAGDVLFNNTNSTELVGKSAIFAGHPEPVTFSNHFTRLRTHPGRLDPRYLARWLTRLQQARVFEGLCTRWVGQSAVKADKLLNLGIPLPCPDDPDRSLTEQRRIADILDKADAIRRKRREAVDLSSNVPLAAFNAAFGDYLAAERLQTPLEDVAEVVSGVAKGRKFNGSTTKDVPYLRVANVQAGYLDLDEIKTIPATVREIEALELKAGDVVMTEGGDYDKLGRGALWEQPIENCIHQNHVFRVRVNREALLPVVFVHFLQTQAAKQYFLRCAKKTTNLATINKTQLRALPVPSPPIEQQHEFARELVAMTAVTVRQSEALREADDLFASLVARAFRGELQ